ncbi:MAG: GNAT family N-acetyltransferase, partial [Thermomicrobiales bacterium]
MKVEFLDPESPRWHEVLAELDHDVYHLPGYAALFAREEGGEAVAFLAEENDQTFFVPLIIRPIAVDLGDGVERFDATCPYGYPGPLLAAGQATKGEDFLRSAIHALVEGLRQRRVVSAFIRLHPLFPLPADPLARAGCLVQHGETVYVDLTRTEE